VTFKKGFEKRLKKVFKKLCRNKKGCMFAAAKNARRLGKKGVHTNDVYRGKKWD